MVPVSQSFEERLQEIEAYLSLLDALEKQAQEGPPKLGGSAITAQQQRILYSAVYLQLYNLVEATVTWCLDAVSAASHTGGWSPADLSDELRREWVRTMARTHVELNGENRLDTTLGFCDFLLKSMPIEQWRIDRRGGGSWDYSTIDDFTRRLGVSVRLPRHVLTGVTRKIRDDKSATELIKSFRNRLAHGSLSFTECGEGVTVSDLKDIKQWTCDYLREVVRCVEEFVASFQFIQPAKRPAVDYSI